MYGSALESVGKRWCFYAWCLVKLRTLQPCGLYRLTVSHRVSYSFCVCHCLPFFPPSCLEYYLCPCCVWLFFTLVFLIGPFPLGLHVLGNIRPHATESVLLDNPYCRNPVSSSLGGSLQMSKLVFFSTSPFFLCSISAVFIRFPFLSPRWLKAHFADNFQLTLVKINSVHLLPHRKGSIYISENENPSRTPSQNRIICHCVTSVAVSVFLLLSYLFLMGVPFRENSRFLSIFIS